MGCSAQEADEVLSADKAIDKDAPMDFDLTPEQLVISRKYTRAEAKKRNEGPTVYNFEKKATTRKKSEEKVTIIDGIAHFLQTFSEISCKNVQVLNAGQEISFDVNGVGYSVKLTAHRKKKGEG